MTSSGVDWSKIQGANKKPKRLHLVGDEEGIFQCPVPHCDHMGFQVNVAVVSTLKTNMAGFTILM